MSKETIADIIDDMSAMYEQGEVSLLTDCDCKGFLNLINRLGKAYARERKEAAVVKEKSEINQREVGNAAKTREALDKFSAVDLSRLKFPLDGDSSAIYNSDKKEITIPYWRVAELLNEVKVAQDMAKYALSAPARNCDLPEVMKDPLGTWRRDFRNWDEYGKPKKSRAEWLLAEAKGEAK